MGKDNHEKEYREACVYLAKLIGYALGGNDPGNKPDCFTWEQLYMLANMNSIASVAFYGIQKLKSSNNVENYSLWETAANLTVYRKLAFAEERRQIEAQMERRGLSYIELKGLCLEECYPEPGMRAMADNDILFGYVEELPEGGYTFSEKNKVAPAVVSEIMEDLNYQAVSIGKCCNDTYEKEPMFCFEMHRHLFVDTFPQYFYYENPWRFAVKKPGSDYHLQFTPEEEYIYMVTHSFKHYDGSGCGVRALVDLFVFLKKYESSLDRVYVSQSLDKMHLLEYESFMRTLSQTAFGIDNNMSQEQTARFCSMMKAGTYGTFKSRITKHTKAVYIKNRIFLKREIGIIYYPVFYRYKILKPFLPIYRFMKGIIRTPRKIWNEIRAVLNF